MARQISAAELPPHPRLLLNQSEIQAIQKSIAGPLAGEWKAFRNKVDAELLTPIELPPRGGNWSHNYVCPEHGTRLTLGKKIGPWQWEHICPVDSHILKGDPSKATTDFDGNAIMDVHLALSAEVLDMALAYQISGDAKYAVRAREILLAYADRYRSYPMHDNHEQPELGGRVASQSLTEATWLIPMTQGADLIWDKLSESDRNTIAEKLLRAALNDCIIPHNLGIHNIQCRHDSAIGLVGFLLDDEKLIHLAIDDPKSGFREEIAKGVHDDGMWHEGASGYHFFAISGLVPLTEAARHCGIDLYLPRFKSMFDGPIKLAMPDMTLPNFNDSSIVKLSSQSHLYQLAYARWHDPKYLSLIDKKEGDNLTSLLYGPKPIDPPAPLDRKVDSWNSEPSGYAILQQRNGEDAAWLCLKYGPLGGGHGHFDKNHFILWSRGSIIMPDAGSHAYGSPLHGLWDKQSLAHNTLVVDEKSQEGATGKSLAFGTEQKIDFSVTNAGPIYKDVRFIRSVAMIDPDLMVVVDQIHSDKEHTFDLAEHLSGKWNLLPPGEKWEAPQVAGYSPLADLTSRGVDGKAATSLSTKLKDGRTAILTLVGSEPTQIITGTGVGESTKDRIPIAIFRRRAKSTAYIWTISLDGHPPQMELLHAKGTNGGELAPSEAIGVQFRRNGRMVDLLVNPDAESVRFEGPAGTPKSLMETRKIFAVLPR